MDKELKEKIKSELYEVLKNRSLLAEDALNALSSLFLDICISIQIPTSMLKHQFDCWIRDYGINMEKIKEKERHEG